MKHTRPVVLMSVLIAVVAFAYWKAKQPIYSGPQVVAIPPLPGKNTISALKVEPDEFGVPVVQFDYFYTGEPVPMHYSILLAEPNAEISKKTRTPRVAYSVERGQHHVSTPIQPFGKAVRATSAVVVSLESRGEAVATERIIAVIDWPDPAQVARDHLLASDSTEQLLERAVTLIDSDQSSQFVEAKLVLERLVHRDAKFAPAYIELARLAMKTNWGPEGLHQAENLLASALQIDSNSINAKILLGYVYTHQKRFAQAEALFSEAAATDTKNLWLWSNWGELLLMKGDQKGAATKYREAIHRPLGHDSNDRARFFAYGSLLTMAKQRNELDEMEALYKQRASEFSSCGCYTEYAKFLIQERGNTADAVSLTKQAIASGNDELEARKILGVAYYLQWATSRGDDRAEALNQARVYLPEGPNALYLLASSARTAVAAKALIRGGESVDQIDNEKFTALALALRHDDAVAVRTLLQLGARADKPVGMDEMPAALIPILSHDIKTIRILQQFGVDYSKIRFRGMTAIDFAKQTGDDELLRELKQPKVTA